MSKQITIKDVARRANVGLGTVSRVINNHPAVKEKTRAAVLAAISELEYNPNANARSLKSKSTRTVGVMIPDISSAFYPEIVRGIEDIASVHQYNIILLNTDMDREKEKSSLKMLKEKKVDGIIFISNTVNTELREEFKKIGIPIVLVATKDFEDNFTSINIDNTRAAYEATDFLCKLGHKHICMIAGDKNDPNAGIPRVEGYKRALADNGIKINEDYIYFGDYRFRSGYDLMNGILSGDILPTAVFAASDSMAIGAACAAMQRGYSIPGDISLIGFDGIEMTQYFYPVITTIKQPRYEMGAKGMEHIIKLLRGGNIEKGDIVLDFTLLEGESHRSLDKFAAAIQEDR